MNEAELFKLAEKFDEDCKPSDFNAPEAEEFDNAEFVEEIEKKQPKKQKKTKTNSKFKDEYFSFYDDIKTVSNHKTEW